MTLDAQNMSTRESLWTKDIPMEKISFTSRLQSLGYNVEDRFNSIMNEVAKSIEQLYQTLMDNVSGAIDIQETTALKKGRKGNTGY